MRAARNRRADRPPHGQLTFADHDSSIRPVLCPRVAAFDDSGSASHERRGLVWHDAQSPCTRPLLPILPMRRPSAR
eukprot:5874696-Prymnesium_polylepis.1